MSEKIGRHIACFPEDDKSIEQLHTLIPQLTAAVIKAFAINPLIFLSPVFRSLILDLARQTQDLHARLISRLYVDNPLSHPLIEEKR